MLKLVSFFPNLLLQFFLKNTLNLNSLNVEIPEQEIPTLEFLLLLVELE